MKKVYFSLCALIFLAFNQLKACEVERAVECMKVASSEQCLRRSHCSKEEYFKAYCPNFHYPDCLDNSTEEKCQQTQNDCQQYAIDYSNFDSKALDRSNLEGYLIALDTKNRFIQNLSGIEFSDFSPFPKNFGDPVINCGGTSSDSQTQTPNNNPKPQNKLDAFFNKAENFGRAVKTYAMGSYQTARTDCSGFLMQSMKRAGMRVMGPQFDLAPNYPLFFKRCDPKNLKAGDMLLLTYPNRMPDHWIMVTSDGKWPSGDIDMMDVSSDNINGKPYYKGKLSRRRNLQNRKIFSCMRHRDLDR